MTPEELKKIIDGHTAFNQRTYDQKTYKIGLNEAIFRDSAQPEPDNRIPVPFIRRAVKLIKGYFAKVGNITYSDETGWFRDNLKEIYSQNGEELATAELFEDAAVYGRGFELHWYDGDFRFGSIPIEQCIPMYTDALKPDLIGFVWGPRVLSDGTEIATYYNETEYQDFTKQKGDKWESGEILPHLYGKVPIIEANVDRDKRNLFDHALPMCDQYDSLTSKVANEHDKFAEAVLLLRDKLSDIPDEDTGESEVDRLDRLRLLDSLGENVKDAAAFLERNVNDTFISNTLDRSERLIYEILCIVNYSADNFAEASGIAQAYKLLSQELMVSDVEAYFVNALYNRMSLIAGHKTSKIDNIELADDVTVNFKRNLPFDMQTMISVSSVALGGKQVLSHRTILEQFPTTVVADPEEELKRIEEESSSASLPSPEATEEENIEEEPGTGEEIEEEEIQE